MKEKAWEAIPTSIRDMIIAAFRMAGIDYEGDFVVPDETGIEKAPPSPWMTRAEAAEFARCSTDTIDGWANSGFIVRVKKNANKPGGVLIDRVSLEKFLRGGTTPPKKRGRGRR